MVIHEIISDEEVGFGDTRKGGGHGVDGGGFVDRDDCDWLSEILDEVGGNKVDDLDDVVFVSEYLPNPPKKPRLEPWKPSAKVEGDDDDDCVVLDGDPDKPVAGVNGKVDVDDDDVQIVGEKGEVACRDFPHARHLCAKFLFASTPHETCCSQCHCYICDSLAPCPHWGTGISSIDHCHATDKDEYWRAERKRMKRGNNPAPAVTHIKNDPLLGRAFCQPTQSLAQPHPVAPRFSATSSNVSGPNAVNQGRAYPVPVYRPRPQVVPPQSTTNKSQHSRRHGSTVGASPSNIRPYGSHSSRNDPLLDIKKLLAARRRGRHVTHQRNVGSRHSHSARQTSSLHGVNVGRANYVPSQNHIYYWPYPTVTADPVHGQSQNHPPSQPYVNFNNFVSVASRPSVDSSIFPQAHALQPNSSSYAGNVFGSGLNSRFTIPSSQNVGNNSGDQFSQPQAHVDPSSVPFGIPIGPQQGNHTQNGLDSIPNIVGSAGEGSQCQSAGPTISPQLHSVKENDICQSKGSLADISSPRANDGVRHVGFSESMPHDICQSKGSLADISSSLENDSVRHVGFSESMLHDALYFQDCNWMLESHSLPVSPLWNSLSPEDTGNLFDV